MATARSEIKFAVNTPTQVLIDITPPVMKLKNLPENICWYSALEHLVHSELNPEGYDKFKRYAEGVAELELKKTLILRGDYKEETVNVNLELKTLSETFLKTEFKQDDKDLKDYMSCRLNKRIALCKRMGIDITASEDIKIENQEALLHAAFMHKIFDSFNLSESKWTPLDSFEDLMQELRLKGPFMVSGHFGPEYYSATSDKHFELAGRTIYHFPPGTEQETNNTDSTHTIIIVGMEKEHSHNTLYYIDPGEQLEYHSVFPKIYAMNEKLFRENIYNIDIDFFLAGDNNKNLPTVTSGPFLLFSPDYAKLQLKFVRDQLREREVVWQNKVSTSSENFMDYRSLQSLSLVSKNYREKFKEKIDKIEQTTVATLSDYATPSFMK